MLKEAKILKLAYRGYYKIYENDAGQYLAGVNMGIPFVIPFQKILKKDCDKIWYIPADIDKAKTRFIIISDGSYKGASIIDLDNMYIIYESEHNNTNIKNHSILEKQIELNACFLALPPQMVKEVVKDKVVIRIFKVGKMGFTKKFVYVNEVIINKDYITNIEAIDFRFKSPNHNIFIEFIEKEKAFVIKNWHKIEFI